MAVHELKQMHWPRPVPLLFWTGDYSDIRERIRRDGKLERDEVWLPNSDDGWTAFCAGHRSDDYRLSWRELEARDRVRKTNAEQGVRDDRARAAWRAQQQWEAEQRRRQETKQHLADREWREAEPAKPQSNEGVWSDREATLRAEHEWQQKAGGMAFWMTKAALYKHTRYMKVTTGKGGEIEGVILEAGQQYWVPETIAATLASRGWLTRIEQ